MADTASDPTADRCQLNATLSSSVHDKNELLSFYQQWSDKYDEVNFAQLNLLLHVLAKVQRCPMKTSCLHHNT